MVQSNHGMVYQKTEDCDYYYYVRQFFLNGEIDVKFISTDKILADVLTKVLPETGHEKCFKRLGVRKLESVNPR